MAEKEKKSAEEFDKQQEKILAKSAKAGRADIKIEDVKLIRILGKDIPGNKRVYHGLTFIKGISWNFANVICKKLNLDKNKRIQDLSESEIKTITGFIAKPEVPLYLLNRRRDYDSGENKHLNGSDLDLQRDFDIKRQKKIKSYKGVRHSAGQPVRGQRTKSHFRSNKKKSGSGVKKGGSATATKTKVAGDKK